VSAPTRQGPAFGAGLDSVMVGRGLLLLGFVCLAVVVLTHLPERLRVFPGMGWGLRSSPGHYLGFVSAVLGCAAFDRWHDLDQL
jgi:hypothetical protein